MKSIFKYGKGLVVLVLSVILIFGTGIVSLADPVDVEEGSEIVGDYVPGKVTNVRFGSYEAAGIKDDNYISWNAIQGATGYQVRLVDSKGNEYGYPNGSSSGGVYKEGYYVMTSCKFDITGYYFIKMQIVEGGYKYIYDDVGNSIKLPSGDTYKIYVRAIRDKEVRTYGPWSDPVSYTIPKAELVKPTNLRIVESPGSDSYEVYYDPSKSKASFEVEIKDTDGNQFYSSAKLIKPEDKPEYVYYNYYTVSGGYFKPSSDSNLRIYYRDGNDLKLKRDDDGHIIRPFVPGKNYTIRIRSYLIDGNGKKECSDWSDPLTVKVPVKAPPEATGNLEFNPDNDSFRFNAVMNASGYQVEIKDSNNNLYSNNNGEFLVSKGNTAYYLKNLYQIQMNEYGDYVPVYDQDGKKICANKPGETYSIRVRVYNYSNVISPETHDYERQYSAWSDTLKCVVTGTVYDDVTKVTGLNVYNYSNSTCTLKWNKAEGDLSNISYEIEIKDSKGRYYKKLDESSGTQELKDYSTTDTSVSKSNLSNIYTYISVDGKYERVIDIKNTAFTPFTPGQTYTLRVRMTADVWKDDSERETKTGPWSDPYTFVAAGFYDESGYNTTPAKVTGLWVEDEQKEGTTTTISNPVIRWNSLDNVNYYQIEVTDNQGHVFSNSAYFSNGKLERSYYYTSSTSASFLNFSSTAAYIPNGNLNAKVLRDSYNNIVRPFAPGQTYKIRVRAYNYYQKMNDDGSWSDTVYHFGEWSDPYTYTVNNIDYKVTNLSFIRREKNYYLFDYTADNSTSSIYYQVATKSDFSAASVVIDWEAVTTTSINSTTYKLCIIYSRLKPNTQYYIRLVNSKYGSPSSAVNKDSYDTILATAAVTSFKTDDYEGVKPKDITGLKKYDESSSYYYFKFDAILEYNEGDMFEVQINTSPDQNNGNWYKYSSYSSSSTSSFSISRNAFVNGDNYLRVVAYKTIDGEEVYGNPSNVVKITVQRDVTSAIGSISLLEENNSSYVFTYSGNPRLDENIYYYYADTSNFISNKNHENDYSSNTANVNTEKTFSISKSSMKPGRTYYIKARVYYSNASASRDRYSSYSNVLKINTTIPKVTVEDVVVKKNSVTIHMNNEYNSTWVKGYEYQRKSGSGKKAKWKTINKSSESIFTNKKLKAFKTYTYRIRPYYYDSDTNKFVYGEWVYTEAMPGWSGSIILHAKAASKTSVKLTWNKVKGAKGYEIYRSTGTSATDEIKNGYNNSFTSYKQIKTLKAGKKSYVDKKLTPLMSYSYIIRAYKMVGKKKVYIQSSASASLDFYISKNVSYQLSDGRYKYEWKPVISAKGYKIEKQDSQTGKWSLYKTIKNPKTTSYIFPASTDYENGDTYRIYAYKGNQITSKLTFTVNPFIAAPTNVKAKVTGNKVTITWNPVKGADYYRVWRTTEPPKSYDKDSKGYNQQSGYEVGRYIVDRAANWGYRQRKFEEMNVTSAVDEALYTTKNGIKNLYIKGPDTGVKYYYYVKAYKVKTQSIYKSEYSSSSVYSSLASKFVSAQINEAKPPKAVISKLTSKKKSVTVTIKGNDKADGYEIQRSLKKKKGFKVIGETKGITATYTDKYNKKKNKLKKGKTYYYRVRSFTYNDNGTKSYSAFSTVKKVKVK